MRFEADKMLRTVFLYVLPLWGVIMPLGLIAWGVLLPVRLIYALLNRGCPLWPTRPVNNDVTVTVVGPEERQARGVAVLIHGWPDSKEMWQEQVAALTGQGYRCLLVELPGFARDAHGVPVADVSGIGMPLTAMVEKAAAAIRRHTSQRVTVICHDWGAATGKLIEVFHPELVKALVVVDVLSFSDSAHSPVFACCYQWFLAVAYFLGGVVGDVLTYIMGRYFLGFTHLSYVPCSVNYPYVYFYISLATGELDYKNYRMEAQCPVLFVYGRDKIIMFHNDRDVQRLMTLSGKGSKTIDYPKGHWVTEDNGERFTKDLVQWMAAVEKDE